MGPIAIVLLTCAVLVLVAAEWPRLSARFGTAAWQGRARRKRKERLQVVRGEGEGDDDFARSVERDLANLPVIEERDGRSRR